MRILIFVILGTIFISCGPEKEVNNESGSNIAWAGLRSSSYGAKPFPDVEGWSAAINKIVLLWEDSYSAEYTIDISNDTRTWKTVHHEKESKGDIEEIKIKETARYLRINGIKRAFEQPEYGHSLWEVKVY